MARLGDAWTAARRKGSEVVRKTARTARLVHNLLDNKMLWVDSTRFEVAILLRGGVGDAVIAARWLNVVLPKLAEEIDLVVDLYYEIPKNIVFVFGNFQQIRYIYNGITFEHVRKYYDFSFVINHLGCLDMDAAALDDLPFRGVIDTWRDGLETFSPFTNSDYHPDLGKDLMGLIRDGGFQRHTILFSQTGIAAPVSPFPFRLPSLSEIADHDALRRPYITIHDGWDVQLRIGDRRPTKSLPPQTWGEFVAATKAAFPELWIIQLGGGAGAHIPGVDLDLKGAIGLDQAARVLEGARLHVDTDSGLVHVAASLGVRSVVFFGPTDRDYYGYPQNLNLDSGACVPCWLSVGNWVDSCMLGDRLPRCMGAFSVASAVDAVSTALREDEVPQPSPLHPA